MGLLSRLSAGRLGLEPLHAVKTKRKVDIPVDRGINLRATLYEPVGLPASPTILIRSPYGRALFGPLLALPLATQGYRVLMQSCRGTADSQGIFDPFTHEEADGLATINWIKDQPFYDGNIATFGPSYLGYVQWAMAGKAGDALKAMCLQVTSADFSRMTYVGDTMQLELSGTWIDLMHNLESWKGFVTIGRHQITGGSGISEEQWRTLPVENLDRAVTGNRVAYWRDWTTHASTRDPWWDRTRHTDVLDQIDIPLQFTSGWHDIVAPWTISDFQAATAAGSPAEIVVGPWWHSHQDLLQTSLKQAAYQFAVQFKGAPRSSRPPVRVYLQRAGEWRNYHQWPPAESTGQTWFLHPFGGLGPAPAPPSEPDVYPYDPLDPTPSVGGPSLVDPKYHVDNTDLEARADVITYTSPALEDDTDVIGEPEATIHFDSTAVSADVFVRLCDVTPDGRSWNVCDGIQRVSFVPGQGPQAVTVKLWPTAYRFRRGHQIRVQISSGAFPRFVRNLGTGEAIGTGTRMVSAEQKVHHAPDALSSITLPIMPNA